MEYKNIMDIRGKSLYYPDFEEKNSSRRWYQHDIDIIIYSNMFRKMQRKGQLLSISDPVSRSRLIHTFEVVRIAKEISEKLKLNTELTEAIALAHDLGNLAYGKIAEEFLMSKTKHLFKHEEVSMLMLKISSSRLIPDKYRKKAKKEIDKDPTILHKIDIDEFPYELEVYKYERDIYYVCMSPEVIDGVKKHGTKVNASTLEGQVVNYADNIAYLIQDVSDFEATGIFDKNSKERYSRCLKKLEEKDSNDKYPLIGIVGETTSLRTATLIERFVSYNDEKISNKKNETEFSELLNTNIPVLDIEPIVKEAIDECWEFKKEYYENELIKVSNIQSELKMVQLWDILSADTSFSKKNRSYIEFKKMLNSPIFVSYKREKQVLDDNEWKEWEKAFFVAHLTCDEIDLIIKSFLERDYVFDLVLPQIK